MRRSISTPLFAVCFLLLSVAARSQPTATLSVSPSQPTVLDIITVTLSGTWPDACTPRIVEVDVNADIELRIGLSGSGPECGTEPTAYSESTELRGLTTGNYTVRAVQIGPFSQSTLDTTDVAVAAGTGNGLQQLNATPVDGASTPEPGADATAADRVVLTGAGIWIDGCTPVITEKSVGPAAIDITLASNLEICPLALTPYTFSTLLGPLPAGDYTVSVRTDDDLDLGSRTLRISDQSMTTAVLDGRFEVSVRFENQQGQSSQAQVMKGAVPEANDLTQATGESALFWFFAPDNAEVVVKVLDACGVFDRFWFFASAATDLAWEITVVDTVTDEERTYSNEAGNPSVAVADTNAFDTCSATP